MTRERLELVVRGTSSAPQGGHLEAESLDPRRELECLRDQAARLEEAASTLRELLEGALADQPNASGALETWVARVALLANGIRARRRAMLTAEPSCV